jgi:hypothetical protein
MISAGVERVDFSGDGVAGEPRSRRRQSRLRVQGSRGEQYQKRSIFAATRVILRWLLSCMSRAGIANKKNFSEAELDAMGDVQ